MVNEANNLGEAVVDRETEQGMSRDARHYYKTSGSAFDVDRASSNFWLGPVLRAYEIAEYGFVEYEQLDFNSGPTYGLPTGKRRFTIYINGHSISRSAASLDEALIVAVAFKRDGCNSQAARFFWRATEPECLSISDETSHGQASKTKSS